MKISIKEIKVEDDGTEILYIGNVGFILKSETFSGALKRCHEKGKEEKGKETRKEETEKEQEIGFEAIAPLFEQIISRVANAQHQAQAGEGAQDQPKNPTKDKKTVQE